MRAKEAVKRYLILLVACIVAIGVGIAFWTGIFSLFGLAQAKPATDPNWQLLGEYEVDDGGKVRVYCNGKLQDVIYFTRIQFGGRTLGHIPSNAVHRPDVCPPKEKEK